MKYLFCLSLYFLAVINVFGQSSYQNTTNCKLGSDKKLMEFIDRNLSRGFAEQQCLLFVGFYVSKQGKLDSLNVLNNKEPYITSDLLDDMRRSKVFDTIWNAGKARTILLPILFVTQNGISKSKDGILSSVSIPLIDFQVLSAYLSKEAILLPTIINHISPLLH